MTLPEGIRPTPWDKQVFGFDTFEIDSPSEAVFKFASKTPGHYTVKLDPLISKHLMYKYGFYYCDTLIVPYCMKEKFTELINPDAGVIQGASLEAMASIAKDSFKHGRFHRDFNIPQGLADLRYVQWLLDIFQKGHTFGLTYKGAIAGFFAYDGGRILLHAVDEKHRGMGLSKYLWSAGCMELYNMGADEVSSSISASNIPALNLYTSLGFRFRKPQDIYHRLTM